MILLAYALIYSLKKYSIKLYFILWITLAKKLIKF
jgi:hypothetical protein